MQYQSYGRILRCLGGLYTIRLADENIQQARHPGIPSPLAGQLVQARARGELRHSHQTPMVGDFVEIVYSERAFTEQGGVCLPCEEGNDLILARIVDRRHALIRPPMANLDFAYVTVAAAKPAPILPITDKLLSILEYSEIFPVLIVTKIELDREETARIVSIYQRAGYPVFPLSSRTGEGMEALQVFVAEHRAGKISAFAGASGVGKSTLLNALYPHLSLETGEISARISRGKQTTRHVELYPLGEGERDGYLADTPGFSMLDFARFDFFSKEDLPFTMREFLPLLGQCRYADCTHTKEEGCAIRAAVARGEIAPSRHESFLQMYDVLKEKHAWDKKS